MKIINIQVNIFYGIITSTTKKCDFEREQPTLDSITIQSQKEEAKLDTWPLRIRMY